jgi:hypothetical protein
VTAFLVATVRVQKAQRLTVRIVALPEKKFDIADCGGVVTSLWRVTAANTKEEAIACVMEAAVRPGMAVSCVRPHTRHPDWWRGAVRSVVRALNDYLRCFDDTALSDEAMKQWLDDTWLPRVRNLVETIPEDET